MQNQMTAKVRFLVGPEDGSYAGLLPIPCQRYENRERQAQDRKMPCLDFAQSPRAGGAMGRGQMDLRGSGKMPDVRQERSAQGSPCLGLRGRHGS